MKRIIKWSEHEFSFTQLPKPVIKLICYPLNL